MKASIKPKSIKFNHTSPETQDKIQNILDQLIKYDIIRTCDEPSRHCNNIHIRNKQHGNDIEILFDHEPINCEAVRYTDEYIKEQTLPNIKG